MASIQAPSYPHAEHIVQEGDSINASQDVLT